MHPPRSTAEAKLADKSGLSYWMSRTLKLVARAAAEQSEENIHDLRTALRRCRSMADGLMALDADEDWARLKKTGGKLFDRLGTLRDIHVQQAWLEKLTSADEPVRLALAVQLQRAEVEAGQEVTRGLQKFDRKEWKSWARRLPARARRLPANGLVLQHLALLRYEDAWKLHRHAMSSPSRAAWHELRLGVKRFRYTVENFLPEQHAHWGHELKRVQDLLGEVHDLDVFIQSLRGLSAVSQRARRAVEQRARAERENRLTEYKALTRGDESLWIQWRAGLPQGQRLETAALAWIRAWAGYRDNDWHHRRHLVRLALHLFDGLHAAQANVLFADARNRRILYAAALVENVGRLDGASHHHKRSYKMIREMRPPVGWSERDVLWTALVARYHRGADPAPHQKGFGSLPPADQQAVRWLAAVLRLADGMVASFKQPVESLRVESSGALHIFVSGISDLHALETVNEKKTLLERVAHRPVFLHVEQGKGIAAAAG